MRPHQGPAVPQADGLDLLVGIAAADDWVGSTPVNGLFSDQRLAEAPSLGTSVRGLATTDRLAVRVAWNPAQASVGFRVSRCLGISSRFT